MSEFQLVRTPEPIPAEEPALMAMRRFLFTCIAGLNQEHDRRWKKLWKRITQAEPGEVISVSFTFSRSGPFHRRHMALESAVFDSQERFADFEQFRVWLKVGAGWVDWCAGPKGGVVPIPRSISYTQADQAEFERYHAQVIDFLRGPYAAKYLWRHLHPMVAAEMMNAILSGFGE